LWETEEPVFILNIVAYGNGYFGKDAESFYKIF
jgi:hypothetical protein